MARITDRRLFSHAWASQSSPSPLPSAFPCVSGTLVLHYIFCKTTGPFFGLSPRLTSFSTLFLFIINISLTLAFPSSTVREKTTPPNGPEEENQESLMESLVKKRKGSEIVQPTSWNYHCQLSIVLSRLSLEDYSRLRKKCRGDVVEDSAASSKSRVSGVVTAPPYGRHSSNPPGRGLKRKIGCIEVATRMGRKKKIEQDYDLGATIGQGKFGYVVMCQNKLSGEKFACKVLKKGQELVHREVEIMQHLSGHPGIVTLKAVYEDSDSFFLVMELCSNGRLLDQMAEEGPYLEQRAAKILTDVILVVKYCHDMGVVHRDIKPENILLTSTGSIKLADFGLAARIVNGQKLSGVVGSPAYVAPEVLAGEYSEKVDIWSAGVLLHALLTGLLPFHGNSIDGVFEAIKTVNLDLESGIWASVSQLARDLIARMLCRDVCKRLSADDVLRHPWILFYTQPSLTAMKFKPKVRKSTRATTMRQVTVESSVESVSNHSKPVGSRSNGADQPYLTGSSKSDELVDVLAVAISHMNISEPKRIRLCNPNTPTQQKNSSNLKTNLCTAF
ncbi:hypothetical protein V2J09_002523 [Rumex salicifolius]